MRIPRTRGAVSAVFLIILGAFGALIPLIGPYFDFTIGATSSWNFGEGHVWLSIVPGAVAVVGGLVLLTSANRATAGLGAWLALLAGAWFVVGEQISQLWNSGTSIAGDAAGGYTQRVAEQLAYFDGLGVLIVAFAALALGRLAVRSVRDVELAHEATIGDRANDPDVITEPPPRTTRESGRFDREPAPVTTTAPRTGEATTPITPAADTTAPAGQSDTLSAADRVRDASDEGKDTSGRGFFRRR